MYLFLLFDFQPSENDTHDEMIVINVDHSLIVRCDVHCINSFFSHKVKIGFDY